MPWFDKPGPKRRPWRNAGTQDVYEAVAAARAYHVQQLSQLASIVLQLNRIESRLNSLEAQHVTATVTDNLIDLAQARINRDEWKDTGA